MNGVQSSGAIPSVDFNLTLTKSLPFEISSIESKVFVHKKMVSRPSFYYLTWIEQGTGNYMLDFVEYPAKPYRLYVLLPGQVHTWCVDKNFKGTSLFFLEECFYISQQQNILEQLELLQYQRRQPFVDIPQSHVNEFKQLFEDLKQEEQSEQLGWTMMIQAQLHRLLIKAQRLYIDSSSQKAKQTPSAASLLTSRFQTLINQQGFTLRSVQAYADKLHISPKHLSETVKSETGQPPSVHIRTRITLEAKRLISHTEKTAQTIAYELGFDDPAYFGRFFKREVGMTPKQFQSAIRSKYQNI